VRITGQEWRRRWLRSGPLRGAPVDDSGLARAGAGAGRYDALSNRHLVAAALARLTQEHRDVLGELYLRGSSVGQAAQALGIAPGTVKSRTYYALRALRLAIEELSSIE
jgi:RNA polymerase sigma-70 factor, ECF subfamily